MNKKFKIKVSKGAAVHHVYMSVSDEGVEIRADIHFTGRVGPVANVGGYVRDSITIVEGEWAAYSANAHQAQNEIRSAAKGAGVQDYDVHVGRLGKATPPTTVTVEEWIE